MKTAQSGDKILIFIPKRVKAVQLSFLPMASGSAGRKIILSGLYLRNHKVKDVHTWKSLDERCRCATSWYDLDLTSP